MRNFLIPILLSLLIFITLAVGIAYTKENKRQALWIEYENKCQKLSDKNQYSQAASCYLKVLAWLNSPQYEQAKPMKIN